MGSIARIHIPLKVYRERRMWSVLKEKDYSIVLESPADASFSFLYVSTGNADCIHDIRVLRMSCPYCTGRLVLVIG